MSNDNNLDQNESVEGILKTLDDAITKSSESNNDFVESTNKNIQEIKKKVNEIMKLKEQIDKNNVEIENTDSHEKINKLQDENQKLKGGINAAISHIKVMTEMDDNPRNTITKTINDLNTELRDYINNNYTTKGGYMYSERGRRKKNTSYKSSARGVLRNNNIENSIELYKNKVRKTKGHKSKGHKSKGHKQKSRKLKAAGMLNVMRMKQTKYKKTKSKGKNKSKAKKTKSKQNKSKKNKSVKRR